MTAAVSLPPRETSPTAARRARMPRGLGYLLIALVAVAAVAVFSLLAANEVRFEDDLDPQNPLPNGAQAVARVVAGRGVDVHVVRSAAALRAEASEIDATTTVLVARVDQLSAETAQDALVHARGAAQVVLLEPRRPLAAALDLPVRVVPASQAEVAAKCSTELADSTDTITNVTLAYQPVPGASAQTCYPGSDGPHLVQLRQDQGPEVVLLGTSSLLSNQEVLEEDNAALALRLLGSDDRLVWYVPDPADIAPGDTAAQESIVPPLVGPSVLVIASAVVALILWRGRRLGRLVTEPLPVVVRAVETTESRGRMYRKARDRNRALVVLQQATRTRLTAYLGMPHAVDPGTLAAAVASVTGRPYEQVLRQLRDEHVADDAALVLAANELATLEQEVRRHE